VVFKFGPDVEDEGHMEIPWSMSVTGMMSVIFWHDQRPPQTRRQTDTLGAFARKPTEFLTID
jgi:hypothetical protein